MDSVVVIGRLFRGPASHGALLARWDRAGVSFDLVFTLEHAVITIGISVRLPHPPVSHALVGVQYL
jgi:hypothetical protein